MAEEIALIEATIQELVADRRALSEQILRENLEVDESTKVQDQGVQDILMNDGEPRAVSDYLVGALRARLEGEEAAEAEAQQDAQRELADMEEQLAQSRAELEALQEEQRQTQIANQEAMNRAAVTASRSPLEISQEINAFDPIGQNNNILSPTFSNKLGDEQFSQQKLGRSERFDVDDKTGKIEYEMHKSQFLQPEKEDLYTSGRLLQDTVDFKYHYELSNISKRFVAIMREFPQIKQDSMFPNFLKSLKFGNNLAFAVFKDKEEVLPIFNENYAIHPCVSCMQDNLVLTASPDLINAILYIRYTKPCKFISFKGCEFQEIFLEAPECQEEAVFVLNNKLRKIDVMECTKLKRAICDISNEKLLKHYVSRLPGVAVGYKGGKGEWDDVDLQIVL